MFFTHNDTENKWDHLVGKNVRSENCRLLGTIVEIEEYIDGYGHQTVQAVLDNGRRIDPRVFGL